MKRVVRSLAELPAAWTKFEKATSGGLAPRVSRTRQADGRVITRIDSPMIPRGMCAVDGRLVPLAQARRSARPLTTPTRPSRAREHRSPASRRSGSGSRTSSNDPGDNDEPEPPSPARLCAAGCGRPAPLSGKGATCGACRTKRSRGQKRRTWFDLILEIRAVEGQIEQLLKERNEAWQLAAAVGSQRFLTRTLTEELQELVTTRRGLLATYRADALPAPRCTCSRTVERRDGGGIVCRALVVREEDGLRCLKCGRDGIARRDSFHGCSASHVKAPAPAMRAQAVESQAAYRRRKAVIAWARPASVCPAARPLRRSASA